MSRGPSTFRQSDLIRALKAAKAAGIEVASYEVGSDGRIVVVTGKPVVEQNPTTPSETDLGL